MDITFKNQKLADIFNSSRLLVKHYGKERATKIQNRMVFLRAADNLGRVPVLPPHRRHELTGDRKDQFAVDLTRNYRLVFEPNHNPVPRKQDGGIDLEQITDIMIVGVEDYHND